MSKQVLFLLLFAAVVGIMPSCQKDPKPQDEGKKDEKPMTPREREIYNMLESAGTLSNEVPTGYGKTAKTLRVDSVAAVQDGKSGMRFTETKHCAFGESDGEFTLLSPWAGILWPGALIQGGSLRGKAVPSSIPLYKKRKPGRIILQVVGGNGKLGDEKWYKECPMRESDVVQAQNELIRQFLASSTQAEYFISVSSVYSKEDLKVKADINLKGFGSKFDAAFAGSWNEEKSHVLVKVVQKFFTITYEDPDDGFNGVFTDDITRQELERYTGDGNPICYVSSVSYGRVYYLLIESSVDSRLLEIGAHANYKSMADVSASLKQIKMMQESKITAFQYGGNASDGMQVAMRYSHEELLKFLQKGAEFGEDNVGAPISFAVKHLYDNSPVHMVNTLEYDYTQTTFVPEGDGNNFAFLVDEIKFEGTPGSGYNLSSRGDYVVDSVILKVRKKVKKEGQEKKELKTFSYNLHPSSESRSLCPIAIFSIKQECLDTCMSDISSVDLYVKGKIISEVWKRGDRIRKSGDFSFDISYSKGQDNSWKLSGAEGGNGVITQALSLEKANYKITLRYRLFVNDRLVFN